MSATPGAFRIDGWLVEPSLNRLARGGMVVRLRPQLLDILAYLAAKPGQVVSKDALLSAIWNDRFVAETAIGRCICELRRALEDDPRAPRIIETVAKRGYRLVASVQPPEGDVAGAFDASAAARPEIATPWRRRMSAITRMLMGAGAALPELARFLARRTG